MSKDISTRFKDRGVGIETVKVAVINMNFKSYWDENGILIISLEIFLLNNNSLDLLR